MKVICLLFVIVVLCAFGSTRATAQEKDAQLWENVYLEIPLTTRLTIHENHEGRITDNVSNFSYGYGDQGLSYRFYKWLRLSADYVFLVKDKDKRVTIRHQFYFDVSFKKKIKPFIFYYREMFQWEYNDINSSETGRIPVVYLRSKLTVKYSGIGKLVPYTASEIYYHTNHNDALGQEFDRVRYFAGFFYEINPVDQVELYYLIEKNFGSFAPPTNYVVGVGFAHTFF